MMSTISYRNNPDWADVTPVPQDDGKNPVCSIAYSKPFVESMDYFRGIMSMRELSPRALALTEDVIEQNSANYTAWYYRRLCLYALQSDLSAELKRVQKLAFNSPKTYQLWHHRRCLLERMNLKEDAMNELLEIEVILGLDSKNYHAWAYRQWILIKWQLWEKELSYIENLIQIDVRNNSAWNHRHFVITHTESQQIQNQMATATSNVDNNNSNTANSNSINNSNESTIDWKSEVCVRELSYTVQQLRRAPHNESAWNYLCGIMQQKHWNRTLAEKCKAEIKEILRVTLLQEGSKSNTNSTPGSGAEAETGAGAGTSSSSSPSDPEVIDVTAGNAAISSCYHGYSALIDLGVTNAENYADEGKQEGKERADVLEELSESLSYCILLANRLDPIRYEYWMLKKREVTQIQQQIQALS